MDVTDLRGQLEQHHTMSFGWSLTCCRQNATEAADVLQTAYLKILDGRAVFKGRSSFKSWLFGVIRNTAADERRRHWLRLSRLGDYFREQTATSELAASNGNEEWEDTLQALRTALAGLPRRQQEVLHLVFYQGLTIQEASSVLNVSVGSARTHYERGRGRLREKLNPSSYHHENHRNGPKVPTTL